MDNACVQWSPSITDTLGPDIFGHFLLSFPVKNVLVIRPFGTKIFVFIT